MENYFQRKQYRSVHQIAFINEHPIHSAPTIRIKGEGKEEARKRAIADGVGALGGVYPLRFCNSYVCCAQIIPLGPFAVSPLQTFDRTRKPQSRKNSFASEPVCKTHVTESGDEIPSYAASARCDGRRREFYASALIRATAVSCSMPKF